MFTVGKLTVGIESTEEKCFVATMPNEILSRIFLDCLDDDPLQTLQPDVTVAPFLLCQICSLWRRVALSLPALWEYLYLDFQLARHGCSSHLPGLSGSPREKVEILELWTSNTSYLHHSLHLSFNNRNNSNRDFRQVGEGNFLPFEELFSLQSIRSARLLDINWLTPHEVPFNPLSHRFNQTSDFPNLEIFAFRDGATRFLVSSREIRVEVQQWMPSLRRLAINLLVIGQEYTFTRDSFHWKILTHCLIACYHTDFRTWHRILTSCVNLVCGAFLLDMSFFKRYEPTVLPNLRQLTIGSSQTISKNMFLDFSFPFLKALRLSNNATPYNHTTSFTIQDILVPMPSLVELHLQTLYGVDNSSDVLSKFVPNLQILVFTGVVSSESTSPLDDIAKTLYSPWLTNGWLSKRTEPGLIKYTIAHSTFGNMEYLTDDHQITEHIDQHLVSLPEYPFTSVVVTKNVIPPWTWPVMTAYDLEHRWDEKMQFYQRSYD